MALETRPHVELTPDLLDAIRSFPTSRRVEHCGVGFAAPALDLYASCPHCGARLKLRAFSGATEVEDIFDAVLAWLDRPDAREVARRRQLTLAEDD